MKGSFSKEALLQYSELIAQKASSDFSEGDTYDFTRCVRPDGSFYGTGGKCKSGSEVGAKEKADKAGGSKPESEANRYLPTKAEKESAHKAIRDEAAKKAAAGGDKGVDAAIKAYNNVKKGATREESGAPAAPKGELSEGQKARQKESIKIAQGHKKTIEAHKAHAANLRKQGKEEEAKSSDDTVAHHTRLMKDALGRAKNPAPDPKMKIDMNTPEGRWFAGRRGF